MSRVTRYQEGKRFEYATRDHLAGEGYWVMRAAASKTVVDLVAIKDNQLLLIQCKRSGG